MYLPTTGPAQLIQAKQILIMSFLVLDIMGAWMLRCYPRLLVVLVHAQIQWHLMCICKLDAHNFTRNLVLCNQLFADHEFCCLAEILEITHIIPVHLGYDVAVMNVNCLLALAVEYFVL